MVLQNAKLRKNREKDSPKVGMLKQGQTIQALQAVVLEDSGALRLRCSAGWCSVLSTKGKQLLSQVASDAGGE
jgi:hypothetical protein